MADRPRVITAGRRTDVPAFYAPRLLVRLEAGLCYALDPYSGRPRRRGHDPNDSILWRPHLVGGDLEGTVRRAVAASERPASLCDVS